jgi:hypothetical protein
MQTPLGKLSGPFAWAVAIIGAVWGVIVGTAALWPVFTRQTLPEWLAAGGWLVMSRLLSSSLLAGLSLLLIAISVLLIIRLRSKAVPANGQQHQRQPNEFIVVDGFEFYPSRQSLSVKRPIKPHINSADVVWALWNAGTSAWANDVVETGKINRLLLPHPDGGQAITLLAQAVRRETEDIASHIRGLTKQAIESGVAVRWFRCGAGNTLTIGNPEKGHGGWILLETLIPFTGANERPSFRISQGDHPALFAELTKAYDRDITECCGSPE